MGESQQNLVVTGPFADDVPRDASNSIMRAQRAFEAALGCALPLTWNLNKTVPVGAGLGSASANAAGALHVLQKIHPLDEDKLYAIARTLGADVPVCLYGQSAVMEGIGDRLTPAPDVASPPMVIVFPNVMLSTQMMFSLYGLQKKEFCEELSIQKMKNVGATHNVFQDLAQQQAPMVGKVLSALRHTVGCALARLSGSGGACFGIYETQEQAENAAQKLKKRYPDFWIFEAKGEHGNQS